MTSRERRDVKRQKQRELKQAGPTPVNATPTTSSVASKSTNITPPQDPKKSKTKKTNPLLRKNSLQSTQLIPSQISGYSSSIDSAVDVPDKHLHDSAAKINGEYDNDGESKQMERWVMLECQDSDDSLLKGILRAARLETIAVAKKEFEELFGSGVGSVEMGILRAYFLEAISAELNRDE
ncbi:hypothetical protein HDU76_011212 [Blyttiomyces sp. JEL0837]|nr:hypothetical protein HDU76_011212 [Blyttiomyces sp. JEL0837]